MYEFERERGVFCVLGASPSAVRPPVMLPMAVLRLGVLELLLQAEQGCGGEEEGTLQGFGSTLIRVIITAGTHTHMHPLELVFAAGVGLDSCGPPHPPPVLVRGGNASSHCEISQWTWDKWPFITL